MNAVQDWMRSRVAAWSLACMVFFIPGTLRASWVIPTSVEAYLADADFIGVVRCAQAGGIVAEYEVVEALKGDASLRSMRIEIVSSYEYDEIPIALVGECFLVLTRTKEPAVSDRPPTVPHVGESPLALRGIAADQRMLAACRLRVEEGDVLEIGDWKGPFHAFRDLATRFLALPPEEQELHRLRTMIAVRLTGIGELDDLIQLVEADSLEDFFDRARMIATKSRTNATFFGQRLGLSCGRASYRLNRSRIPEVFAVDANRKNDFERVLLAILISNWGQADTIPSEPPAPSDEADGEADGPTLQRGLGCPVDEPEFDQAFATAIRFQPEIVVDWLLRFDHEIDRPYSASIAYRLISHFAIRVERDRAKHFARLLEAKDPFIRAGAAIYLAFEDEEAGRRALLHAMQLPGEAGGWAALAVASRGNRDGITQAIDRLSRSSGYPSTQQVHRASTQRLLVLLSNSAAAAGVAFPIARTEEFDRLFFEDRESFEKLKAWWGAHSEVICPHDPWFAELAAQKID